MMAQGKVRFVCVRWCEGVLCVVAFAVEVARGLSAAGRSNEGHVNKSASEQCVGTGAL